MNILYITTTDPRKATYGGEQRTHFIWKALCKIGNVYTFRPVGGDVEPRTDDEARIRMASVDSPSKMFFLMDRLMLRWFHPIRLPFRSARFIRSRIGWPGVDFDCVVVRYINNMALTAAWKLAPKCIVDIDDSPLQVFDTVSRRKCNWAMGKIKHAVIRFWMKFVLRHADVSWIPNEEMIDEMLEFGPCTHLPNIAMPPKPSYRFDAQKKFQLMTVGWMAYQPNYEGVDWFIREVWPFVHQVHPALEYVIAGKGVPTEYEACWKSTPGVRLLGFVDDIDKLYEESVAVVAPIFAGSGTCIKIVEALMRGKRVFATLFAIRGMTSGLQNLSVLETLEQWKTLLPEWLSSCNSNDEAMSDPFEYATAVLEKFDSAIAGSVINVCSKSAKGM